MAPQINLEEAAKATELPSAEEVLGDRDEIPIEELFDSEFMAQYTEFTTFEEMVRASPSNVDSLRELTLIPDGTWDEFVAETTTFDDEEEMVFAVRDHWVATKLGL
ncbi:hypothetical protein [Haloferax denitrificans]|uniref:hypothetical protein n=1 Tax=Haloferax denitrificans TaxID=35745 RepID=UPI003C6F5CB6